MARINIHWAWSSISENSEKARSRVSSVLKAESSCLSIERESLRRRGHPQNEFGDRQTNQGDDKKDKEEEEEGVAFGAGGQFAIPDGDAHGNGAERIPQGAAEQVERDMSEGDGDGDDTGGGAYFGGGGDQSGDGGAEVGSEDEGEDAFEFDDAGAAEGNDDASADGTGLDKDGGDDADDIGGAVVAEENAAEETFHASEEGAFEIEDEEDEGGEEHDQPNDGEGGADEGGVFVDCLGGVFDAVDHGMGDDADGIGGFFHFPDAEGFRHMEGKSGQDTPSIIAQGAGDPFEGEEGEDGEPVEDVVNEGGLEGAAELAANSEVAKGDEDAGDGGADVGAHDHVDGGFEVDHFVRGHDDDETGGEGGTLDDGSHEDGGEEGGEGIVSPTEEFLDALIHLRIFGEDFQPLAHDFDGTEEEIEGGEGEEAVEPGRRGPFIGGAREQGWIGRGISLRARAGFRSHGSVL